MKRINFLRFVVFTLLITAIFVLTGCIEDKKHLSSKTCNDVALALLAIPTAGSGSTRSIGHDLVILDYKEDCMDKIDYIKLIRNYLDTVSTSEPISSISLFNSNKAFPDRNEMGLDMRYVEETHLVSIGLEPDSCSRNKVKVSYIIFYKDGKTIRIKLDSL
ncbi:MAG: hypothetical protein SF053_16515 [Bacteroidia bacterium]|nr:hypothetical protein [Bacteroidia bacterium]